MSFTFLYVLMTFLSISVQLPMDVYVRVYVSELDLGLKKDVFSSDGSSLEALLKGEPLDKRSSLELRTGEEEPSSTEFSTGALNPSSRVRKVLRTADDFDLICHCFCWNLTLLSFSVWFVFTRLCVCVENFGARWFFRWSGWWRLWGRYSKEKGERQGKGEILILLTCMHVNIMYT